MRPKIISDLELLELATEVVLQHGPQAFTLRQIAQHAKVSPATLVKRFKSRDRLLNACIVHHSSKMLSTTPAPGFRIEGYLQEQLRHQNKNNFIQHLSLLAKDMSEPALRKLAQKYFENFRRTISQILKNDRRFQLHRDHETFVFLLEAQFHGAVMQGAFLKNTSIQKSVQSRMSEFMKGMTGVELEWR